jgi:hypothetical protein
VGFYGWLYVVPCKISLTILIGNRKNVLYLFDSLIDVTLLTFLRTFEIFWGLKDKRFSESQVKYLTFLDKHHFQCITIINALTGIWFDMFVMPYKKGHPEIPGWPF